MVLPTSLPVAVKNRLTQACLPLNPGGFGATVRAALSNNFCFSSAVAYSEIRGLCAQLSGVSSHGVVTAQVDDAGFWEGAWPGDLCAEKHAPNRAERARQIGEGPLTRQARRS
jgi:hypothetical protein